MLLVLNMFVSQLGLSLARRKGNGSKSFAIYMVEHLPRLALLAIAMKYWLTWVLFLVKLILMFGCVELFAKVQ